VDVFTAGEGGYFCIKIPGMIQTTNGTLIAFGEARMFSCSDYTWTGLHWTPAPVR
jgi:sialidase-1